MPEVVSAMKTEAGRTALEREIAKKRLTNSMMFYIECGSNIPRDSKFCMEC